MKHIHIVVTDETMKIIEKMVEVSERTYNMKLNKSTLFAYLVRKEYNAITQKKSGAKK